ncbi:MAG: NupC/NupG family nucleoside CNT transporter [Planctomycetota bacterium]|nr:MAG: NupC/NupG family nucleoside CNT transporter [Planctomycetota bacterium]
MEHLQGLIGVLVLLGIAFALSENRRAIRWRVVLWGMALQAVFALLILRTQGGRAFFAAVDGAIRALLGFSYEGAEFVFKSFGKQEIEGPLQNFAFTVLPTIIFFSALMAMLYHVGLMQLVIGAIAWLMRRTMKTSGAETMSAAANIFVGQTEAPLMVRPFVPDMTRSELMAIMTCGFATVAGGVMAMYVGLLKDVIPGIAGHLMAASIMSAPAGLVIAKIMVPETGQPKTSGDLPIEVPRPDANLLEALGRGATEGMQLLLNVAAMLIAFVGILAMLNAGLGLAGTSLQELFGVVFRPLAWCMGAPWDEADELGRLMGEKIVLTELIAYGSLRELAASDQQLSPRTAVIASYALCGFANFASIGIQIGGIGGMAPSRRSDLAELGLRAMFAGALASWLTAALAGILFVG